MLKIRIKPEGKIFVNGKGWLKNVGNRPIDVIVSPGVGAEREKRIEELAQQLYAEAGFNFACLPAQEAWIKDREDVRQRFRELAQEKIRGSRSES